MIWYFLISDTFTFAGLLISYGAVRTSQPSHKEGDLTSWPDPNEVFSAGPGFHHAPLVFVTFMTFTLIVSSVTMVRAVQEGHYMNKAGVAKWLVWTIIGGLIFVLSQAWEWTHLIHEGMNLKSNPFGASSFGALFFLITGFHGLHVSVGVLMNTWALISTQRGVFHRRGHYEMIEKLGLYWHFVDLVWVYVFLAFYLL
ncbi:MAG: cytochrome c oxidase subunit 3 [Fimbriimonadaceae bacterium]|nr:cytochrome c oxidase subunit 3 [Chitinophagales bacterium]